MVLPNTRLPILLVQQGEFGTTFTEQTARGGIEVTLGRGVSKQIANQNCFWPVSQTMADELLGASKIIIRYIALYSMAGVAMESRLFRIHPSARDTPFIDACTAFLTPKMDLSQVMPSGCNLRRIAQPPDNQLAVSDRPSASDYQEEESVVDPADMHMALVTPAFQPYRGATGRTWMAQEYGLQSRHLYRLRAHTLWIARWIQTLLHRFRKQEGAAARGAPLRKPPLEWAQEEKLDRQSWNRWRPRWHRLHAPNGHPAQLQLWTFNR